MDARAPNVPFWRLWVRADSASCSGDGSVCQATCDDGYEEAGGDGVFSCANGRWTGSLVCKAPNCGPTVDKQPVRASK